VCDGVGGDVADVMESFEDVDECWFGLGISEDIFFEV
jgi:hypothetical protein